MSELNKGEKGNKNKLKLSPAKQKLKDMIDGIEADSAIEGGLEPAENMSEDPPEYHSRLTFDQWDRDFLESITTSLRSGLSRMSGDQIVSVGAVIHALDHLPFYNINDSFCITAYEEISSRYLSMMLASFDGYFEIKVGGSEDSGMGRDSWSFEILKVTEEGSYRDESALSLDHWIREFETLLQDSPEKNLSIESTFTDNISGELIPFPDVEEGWDQCS